MGPDLRNPHCIPTKKGRGPFSPRLFFSSLCSPTSVDRAAPEWAAKPTGFTAGSVDPLHLQLLQLASAVKQIPSVVHRPHEIGVVGGEHEAHVVHRRQRLVEIGRVKLLVLPGVLKRLSRFRDHHVALAGCNEARDFEILVVGGDLGLREVCEHVLLVGAAGVLDDAHVRLVEVLGLFEAILVLDIDERHLAEGGRTPAKSPQRECAPAYA